MVTPNSGLVDGTPLTVTVHPAIGDITGGGASALACAAPINPATVIDDVLHSCALDSPIDLSGPVGGDATGTGPASAYIETATGPVDCRAVTVTCSLVTIDPVVQTASAPLVHPRRCGAPRALHAPQLRPRRDDRYLRPRRFHPRGHVHPQVVQLVSRLPPRGGRQRHHRRRTVSAQPSSRSSRTSRPPTARPVPWVARSPPPTPTDSPHRAARRSASWPCRRPDPAACAASVYRSSSAPTRACTTVNPCRSPVRASPRRHGGSARVQRRRAHQGPRPMRSHDPRRLSGHRRLPRARQHHDQGPKPHHHRRGPNARLHQGQRGSRRLRRRHREGSLAPPSPPRGTSHAPSS